MKGKILGVSITALMAVLIIILVITFSIGLPIYIRPFYYVQINALDMPDRTGYDYDTIKEAYDEVLDYLTLPGREFGTGKLAYSQVGEGHFADCKVLFDLNIWAFFISLILLCVIFALVGRRIVELRSPFGLNVGFWSGAVTLSVFTLLGILVSLDFDTAFVIFHAVFFPGKDNWIFDPRHDEIIKVMPEEFFMNCAILIASSIILISLGLIAFGVAKRRKSGRG